MMGRLFNVVLVIFLLVATLFIFTKPAAADTDYEINITAGRIYLANLAALFDTLNWVGLKIVNSGASLSVSPVPFAQLTLDSASILEVSFPGDNLKNRPYYYAAMLSSNFSLLNVMNASTSDLVSGGMFNSGQFPTFYPNYALFNDNPLNTFCCATTSIKVGGTNYTALSTTLDINVNYYILKYNQSGTITPLFLVPITDSTCYNSSSCAGQFLLPVTSNDYYFYGISEESEYNFTVDIDGVRTTTFSQVALPYLVDVSVFNVLSGNPAANVPVIIHEADGKNLFIPYDISGSLSTAYARDTTNASGGSSFVVVPTGYPTSSTYNITVAVISPESGDFLSPAELTVTDTTQTVLTKKPISDSSLDAGVKQVVNYLIQVQGNMRAWADGDRIAKDFTLNYNIGSNSFTETNNVNGGATPQIELQSGGINILSVTASGGSTTGYTFRVRENEGFLVMSPYTASSPYDLTNRTHYNTLTIGSTVVITPTVSPTAITNVSVEIYNPSNTLVAIYNATVETDLNVQEDTRSYTDTDVVQTLNALTNIIGSVFYALN